MPKMRESMKLRKTPGGEETGREAPIDFEVTITDQDAKENPKFFKVQVGMASGQPEGWVAADSVDPGDSTKPIDKGKFAKKCWRSAIDFGANAHYLASVASLRSGIADGKVGAEEGPFRLLPSEWAANWDASDFQLRLDPELIYDWRMQCAAFALMAFRIITKLETKLRRRPNSIELLLAQMAGIGVAAVAQQSDESLQTLIAQQAADDLPPGQKSADIPDRFAKWFKKDRKNDEQPVTGKVAYSAIESDLQEALDDTRQLIESAGGKVIADVFDDVQSETPSAAKVDLKTLNASQQAMAKKIMDAFAQASFATVQ